MRDERELNPAERELERMLGELEPLRLGLSGDEVLFQAGVRLGRRQARVWQGVAAAAVGVNLALAALFSSGVATQQPEPVVVYMERSAPAAGVGEDVHHTVYEPLAREPALARGGAEMLRLRNWILKQGADALPPARGGGHMAERLTVGSPLQTPAPVDEERMMPFGWLLPGEL